MDRTSFDKYIAQRLAGTIQVCGGRALTQPAIDAWCDALCDFDVNETFEMLSEWPRYHKAAPTPYDLAKEMTAARERASERRSRAEVSASRSGKTQKMFAPVPMPKWCIDRLEWIHRCKVPQHLNYYRLRFIELHPEVALRPLLKVQIDWLRAYEKRFRDMSDREMAWAIYVHGLGALPTPACDGTHIPNTLRPTRAQIKAAELMGITRQQAIDELTFRSDDDSWKRFDVDPLQEAEFGAAA